MDIITQGILGAAIAEAGWRKKLGKGAIAAGILFGLMPDFDVISGLWGEWVLLVHHRGFTHSIFFAPLVAPLGGWVFWRTYGKRGDLTSWMHMIFWVLLTHPLLDVFTTYGTQLLTPVTNERFAIDGISIVDPIYTVPMMIALGAAWIWRKKPDFGRRAATAALAWSTLYLGVGYMMAESSKREAVEQFERADRPPMVEVRATPSLANIVLWKIVARDEQQNIYTGLYSQAAPGTIDIHVTPKPDSPLIDTVMESERGRLFHWFAMEMIGWRLEEGPDGTVYVYMDDLRYANTEDVTKSLWGAKATFDADQNLVGVERVRYASERDFGEMFSLLWQYMWEGPPYADKISDASSASLPDSSRQITYE